MIGVLALAVVSLGQSADTQRVYTGTGNFRGVTVLRRFLELNKIHIGGMAMSASIELDLRMEPARAQPILDRFAKEFQYSLTKGSPAELGDPDGPVTTLTATKAGQASWDVLPKRTLVWKAYQSFVKENAIEKGDALISCGYRSAPWITSDLRVIPNIDGDFTIRRNGRERTIHFEYPNASVSFGFGQ